MSRRSIINEMISRLVFLDNQYDSLNCGSMDINDPHHIMDNSDIVDEIIDLVKKLKSLSIDITTIPNNLRHYFLNF